MEWTPSMQRWLEDSCRASGVPLTVSDPEAIAKIATLLRVPSHQGDAVARSEAARQRQGLSSNGKVTGSKREVGQYGNSRPRDDAHVRRARRMETDGRLKAAKAALEEHERKLAELDRTLNGQPHVPYTPTLTVVPEPEEKTVPPKDQAVDYDKIADGIRIVETGTPVDATEALQLIGQGYHIDRVVQRTGVPWDRLKNLVGADGYRRGGW